MLLQLYKISHPLWLSASSDALQPHQSWQNFQSPFVSIFRDSSNWYRGFLSIFLGKICVYRTTQFKTHFLKIWFLKLPTATLAWSSIVLVQRTLFWLTHCSISNQIQSILLLCTEFENYRKTNPKRIWTT